VRVANVVAGPAAPQPDPVPPGTWCLLAVSDDGAGMDAETLSRVFEPLFTTRASEGGTGLGLATVYSVVHQGGGHVFAESAPGSGSTFRVYLPVAEGVPEEPTPERTAPHEAVSGARILVAEDDDLVRRFMCGVLRQAGYLVTEAARPADALAALENTPLDLLVTDLVMPEMNGHELATSARRSRPDLRVLYVSGYAEGSELRERVSASGDAFLPKPFSQQELLGQVAALLRQAAG
jgi:CheY-like chemotaxis protein